MVQFNTQTKMTTTKQREANFPALPHTKYGSVSIQAEIKQCTLFNTSTKTQQNKKSQRKGNLNVGIQTEIKQRTLFNALTKTQQNKKRTTKQNPNKRKQIKMCRKSNHGVTQ